jgi:hypothetical protein
MGAKVGGKGLLRLLLDPQGKTVAADRSFTLDDFEDPEAFTKSFTDFTQGADGARLRDHAKAIEAGFTDELKKAAEQLRGDDAVAGKAMETLTASADVIAPWLVNRSRGEDGSKFESVLWNYYLQQSVKDPEPALPYGLRVERVAVEDPCPSCGMAAYRPVAYRFLSFLTK